MPDELVIELTPGDGVSAARFDRLCGDLAEEVRTVRGLAVAVPEIEGTPGAKSGFAQEIGTLIVTGLFSVAGLKAVADIVVACLQRSTIGTATIRIGDVEATMTGLKPEDVPAETAKLIEALKEAR